MYPPLIYFTIKKLICCAQASSGGEHTQCCMQCVPKPLLTPQCHASVCIMSKLGQTTDGIRTGELVIKNTGYIPSSNIKLAVILAL